ncbi:hypothetical protein ANN_09776 [Periplaneta americana]|uniref:Uncharacterized protein n=1 Tax=Periplaneta americana TaxID=6978 RepID=A0ABQ8TPI6_PERAM|nr:hypothetical protein ANN_09776 [Periplaneta americana]
MKIRQSLKGRKKGKAVDRSTVSRWASRLSGKRGHANIRDTHRKDRTSTARSPDIVQRVNKMVVADKRVTVKELSLQVGIGEASMCRILKQLGLKKFDEDKEGIRAAVKENDIFSLSSDLKEIDNETVSSSGAKQRRSLIKEKLNDKPKNLCGFCSGNFEDDKHVIPRWGTWLRAKNFEQIARIVNEFSEENSLSIKAAQCVFIEKGLKEDLEYVDAHFTFVVDAIQQLEANSLSLGKRENPEKAANCDLNPRKSIARRSQQLRLPESTEYVVAWKRLKLHAYEIQLLHAIKPRDKISELFFFAEHINHTAYTDMLENFLFPQMEQTKTLVFKSSLNKMVHRLTLQEELNRRLPERFIGKNTPSPPRNLDLTSLDFFLTSLDFFLCGYVKHKVYSENIPNLVILKKRIRQAIASVTPDDLARL